MAIRLITAADLPTLRTMWDEYRAAEAAAYAREQGWTLARLTQWLAAPHRWLAIDPATGPTVGVFRRDKERGEVVLIATRRTGLSGRRAADAMFLWAARRAQTLGVTEIYGDYVFPDGVDWANTRAVRYFGDSFAATTVETAPSSAGTYVLITAANVPALIAELEAR